MRQVHAASEAVVIEVYPFGVARVVGTRAPAPTGRAVDEGRRHESLKREGQAQEPKARVSPSTARNWLMGALAGLIAFPAWPVSIYFALLCFVRIAIDRPLVVSDRAPFRRRLLVQVAKGARIWFSNVVVGVGTVSLCQGILGVVGWVRPETVQVIEVELRLYSAMLTQVLSVHPLTLASTMLLICLAGWILSSTNLLRSFVRLRALAIRMLAVGTVVCSFTFFSEARLAHNRASWKATLSEMRQGMAEDIEECRRRTVALIVVADIASNLPGDQAETLAKFLEAARSSRFREGVLSELSLQRAEAIATDRGWSSALERALSQSKHAPEPGEPATWATLEEETNEWKRAREVLDHAALIAEETLVAIVGEYVSGDLRAVCRETVDILAGALSHTLFTGLSTRALRTWSQLHGWVAEKLYTELEREFSGVEPEEPPPIPDPSRIAEAALAGLEHKCESKGYRVVSRSTVIMEWTRSTLFVGSSSRQIITHRPPTSSPSSTRLVSPFIEPRVPPDVVYRPGLRAR